MFTRSTRASLTLAALAFCAAANAQTATRVLLSNDDGWASANIRAQYAALREAGYDVVLSAPALNGSGTGSLDAPPVPVLAGCEFDSCPALSPATGSNATDPRLNYVNSFPVRAVKVGIQTTAPRFFAGAPPDLVVSGPNVGHNTGLAVLGAGTVGAAVEGAREGVPAVAFSGGFGTQTGYLALDSPSAATTAANTYAALGVQFLAALLAPPPTPTPTPTPILPPGVVLNVNYPNATGACAAPGAYRFVLTRVFAPTVLSGADVRTCGAARLPTEAAVVARADGCFASVSVVRASSKLDASAGDQQAVLDRLGGFLTCIPST